MYARGVYHVAGHASDDRSLFIDDIDRRFFLDHLAETVALLGLRVISYVLMTNHHHVLIDTPDSRIASVLHRLHGGYAREHNIRHIRTAHLFRAHPLVRRIEDNDDLKWTDRYIACNPVEAALVPDPFDWFWSAVEHTQDSQSLLSLSTTRSFAALRVGRTRARAASRRARARSSLVAAGRGEATRTRSRPAAALPGRVQSARARRRASSRSSRRVRRRRPAV
jgi:REP element-mobilizing transposase RayT